MLFLTWSPSRRKYNDTALAQGLRTAANLKKLSNTARAFWRMSLSAGTRSEGKDRFFPKSSRSRCAYKTSRTCRMLKWGLRMSGTPTCRICFLTVVVPAFGTAIKMQRNSKFTASLSNLGVWEWKIATFRRRELISVSKRISVLDRSNMARWCHRNLVTCRKMGMGTLGRTSDSALGDDAYSTPIKYALIAVFMLTVRMLSALF